MTLRITLVALALVSLVGCPDSSGSDAGRDAAAALDTPATLDTPAALDTPALADTGTMVEDDAPPVDAFVTASGDASGDAHVAGDAFTRDTRGALPGMCNPEACTPTCFRNVQCVTECGGPVTECGCCACATGSMDAIGCHSSM